MIVATPFISGLTNYSLLADAYKKRGTMHYHVHLVLSDKVNEEEAYEFGKECADVFHSSKFIALPDFNRRQFQLANDLFRAAVRFAQDYQPGEDESPSAVLLYMDPKYRPIKQNWLATLQSEYHFRNNPLVMSRPETGDGDKRMFEGPIVLRKDFGEKSALLDFLPPESLWRNYLRSELGKNHVTTHLIGGHNDAVLRPAPNPSTKK